MKIAILVNTLETKEGSDTTTYRLAAEGVRRGHEVWMLSAGSFAYDPDDEVRALAKRVPAGKHSSEELAGLLGKKGEGREWIDVLELDVLLLRSNPSVQKEWAQTAGIHFGRIAARQGVIVLNDPNGLAKAMNKLYLQRFPEFVRPLTLITRDQARIEAFVRDQGKIVIKPLQGSGGKSVFLVRTSDIPNLAQMIRAVSRDGYVVAQEYLPAAAQGDTRLFLMNGVPLSHGGEYAAFRRIGSGEDVRSNIHAGGRLRRAHVDDTILELAEAVRPRLVADGMFLVGLDVVGDKLMEINVFTPGGLGGAERLNKVSFTEIVLNALERKVQYAAYYRRLFDNVEIATL